MPVLDNPKYEAFAQAYAKGETADHAYRLAGYSKNRSNARRLSTNEHIMTRVKELQTKVAAKAEVTLESILMQLLEERELAMKLEKPRDATAATVAMASLAGLDPIKRTEQRNTNVNYDAMTPDELKFEMTAILQEARKLGAKH